MIKERNALALRIRKHELEDQMEQASHEHNFAKALLLQAKINDLLGGEKARKKDSRLGGKKNVSSDKINETEGLPFIAKDPDNSSAIVSDDISPGCIGRPCCPKCEGQEFESASADGRGKHKPSKRTCEDLGWNTELQMSRYGHPSVCGQSVLDGKCSGRVSYEDAKKFCRSKGARLCSVYELESDNTRGSGCGYDHHSVWSHSKCKRGHHYTRKGSSEYDGKRHCVKDEKLKVARCCADSHQARFRAKGNIVGPLVKKSSPATYSDEDIRNEEATSMESSNKIVIQSNKRCGQGTAEALAC
uniref:Uncharacterized protein n=1 Tax=Lotharella oceanica TaxID=641309 RepID=A0A7S2X9N9_9EUKA